MGLGLARQQARALQPRLRRSRGQAVERAQEIRLVGRRERQVDRPRRAGLRRRPATVLPSARGRHRHGRDLRRSTRSSCRPTARHGCSRPAGLVDGPLPAHYEPQESPVPNPLYGQQRNPVREIIRHRENRYQPSGDRARVRGVPLRDHHLPAYRAPHRGRHVAPAALPGGAAAGVLLRGVAGAGRGARARTSAAGRRSSPLAARSRLACSSPNGCGR